MSFTRTLVFNYLKIQILIVKETCLVNRMIIIERISKAVVSSGGCNRSTPGRQHRRGNRMNAAYIVNSNTIYTHEKETVKRCNLNCINKMEIYCNYKRMERKK